MANTKSAKKATRTIAKRTSLNKNRRTAMRTTWRQLEEAVASGDAPAAREALKNAESETRRAVGKRLLHKNAASRKVSRLAKRVKNLEKT